MTRARDELYVCGYKIHKDSPENSWYRLVEEAVQSQGILRAVESPDGNPCQRYGPDPTWNGIASVLPKASQERSRLAVQKSGHCSSRLGTSDGYAP